MDLEESRRKRKYLEKYNYMKDYIGAPKKVSVGNSEDEEKKRIDLNFIFEKSLKDIVSSQKEFHGESNKAILKGLEEKYFDEIEFYLKSDFNVAIYGYGSKYQFLKDFSTYKMLDYPKVSVLGFSSSASLKNIVTTIEEFIFKCFEDDKEALNSIKVKGRKLEDQLIFIDRAFELDFPYERLIIVIHNIDGKNLRDIQSQTCLSTLADHPKIKLLVSFDHVRYSTLLSPQMFEKFGFVFMNINTYQLYEAEFQYQDNMVSVKQDRSREALKYIFKSLNTNQKDIIKVIAEFVIKSKNEIGISFKALLEKCIDEIIINNETQLKENLIEIIDHHVVVEKKGDGGKLFYTMKYSNMILERIISGNMEFDGEEEEDEEKVSKNTAGSKD